MAASSLAGGTEGAVRGPSRFAPDWRAAGRSAVGIAAALLLWWGASAIWANRAPSPLAVAEAWMGLLRGGELAQGLWGTGRSFLAAWAIAGAVGLGLAVLMALSETLRDGLMPVIEILRPIPSAAIIPLAIVLLGLDDRMKIAVAVYAAIWPVLMTASAALRRIDLQLRQVCWQFGLRGRLRYLLQIQLPSVGPEILSSLRTASVVALALTVTTELVSTGDGLGNWIVRYDQAVRVPEMYACIVTVMILGSALYALAAALERSLTRWVARPL